MPVFIRKATISDMVDVLDLFKALPSRHRKDEYAVDQSVSSEIYREIIDDPELGVILVAVSYNRIVGVITLSYPVSIRTGGPYARIEEYIVDSNQRGMGIGGKLLDAALHAAREKGCYDIQVNNPSNLGKPLYEKRGFNEGGEYWRKRVKSF